MKAESHPYTATTAAENNPEAGLRPENATIVQKLCATSATAPPRQRADPADIARRAQSARRICTAQPVRRRPLEVLLVFLRLDVTCFNGPIAHIGYFRDEGLFAHDDTPAKTQDTECSDEPSVHRPGEKAAALAAIEVGGGKGHVHSGIRTAAVALPL
jgi:hypothetical protein